MVFPWICSNVCVQPPRRYLRSIPFRCQIEGVGSKGTERFTIRVMMMRARSIQVESERKQRWEELITRVEVVGPVD